jgi:hypothetical protein
MDCWVLDYKPTFKNLVFPKSHYEKIQHFIKDKTIPMNLHIYGSKGCGKLVYLKCILKECFDITFDDFKEDHQLANTLYYKSIYIFDFSYYNSADIRNIMDFIRKYSRRTLIDTSLDKIIIIRNIQNLNERNIKSLTNIIEKNNSSCKYIFTSSKPINKAFKGYFCSLRLNKMTETQLSSSLKKILKHNSIKLDDTKLTKKKIYKTYQDMNYNFRDLVLWIQYAISQNGKGSLPIKQKLVASMLNYVFIDNSKDPLKEFAKIKEMLIALVSMGIPHIEIVKISLSMILSNPNIEHEKKHKIIEMCGETSKELANYDRKIFALEKLFINISILCK